MDIYEEITEILNNLVELLEKLDIKSDKYYDELE